MIVDEEVQSFLEHHGVKGQKWGVRNKFNKTKSFIKKHKKGIAIGTGGLAVIAGTIYAKKYLNSRGAIKIKDVPKLSPELTARFESQRRLLKLPCGK